MAPALLVDETSESCSPNTTKPTKINPPSAKSEQYMIPSSVSAPPFNFSKAYVKSFRTPITSRLWIEQVSDSIISPSRHLNATTPSTCHFPIIAEFGNCQSYGTKPIPSLEPPPTLSGATQARSHSKNGQCNTMDADYTSIRTIPKSESAKAYPHHEEARQSYQRRWLCGLEQSDQQY